MKRNILDKLIKSNLELLYNSASDTKLYNNIFNDLKNFFIEYMKAKYPVIGAFSALRQDKLMKIEEERLNSLINILQSKAENLDRSKIDYSFIRTEEFARIAFDVFEKARVDYREEKLKYYANILLNYITVNFSNDFYKEGIIEKLSKCTPEHIIILKKAYDFYYIEPKNKEGLPKGYFKIKEIEIDNFNEQMLVFCIVDLQSYGLLYNLASFRFDGAINEEFVISEYGIKCVKLISEKNKMQ